MRNRPRDVGSFKRLEKACLVSPACWCDPDLHISRARSSVALGHTRLCGCFKAECVNATEKGTLANTLWGHLVPPAFLSGLWLSRSSMPCLYLDEESRQQGTGGRDNTLIPVNWDPSPWTVSCPLPCCLPGVASGDHISRPSALHVCAAACSRPVGGPPRRAQGPDISSSAMLTQAP